MQHSSTPAGLQRGREHLDYLERRSSAINQKRYWFMGKVRVFQDISTEDAEYLDGLMETIRCKRKQVVFMPGDASDRVYFIRSGLVKISKVTDDGKELTLMFLSQGDLFGELAVADAGPRNVMAEVYDDSVICSIERAPLAEFVQTRSGVAFEFLRVMSERRRRLENKMDSLLFRGAHSRLASLFIELAMEFGVRDSRGTIVNLKLTHREMANLIGSTRETVSFALLDMKKDKLIETDGKRVVLVDVPRLEQLAFER